MRTLTKSIWAAACAIGLCLSSGPAAAQFNQFYFFGDSLSDAGSFKPVLPPGTGKFTTNPGPIWAEVFAQRYGSSATPANQGGNDFAEGGARVTQLPGVPASPPTGTATPVCRAGAEFPCPGCGRSEGAVFGVGRRQRSVSPARPGAGRRHHRQPTSRPISPLPPCRSCSRSAVLNAAGARYIIVFNMPDVGSTPFGRCVRPGSDDHRVVELFQQHAQHRPRRAAHRRHPAECFFAVERNRRRSRRRTASPTPARPRARSHRCSALLRLWLLPMPRRRSSLPTPCIRRPQGTR